MGRGGVVEGGGWVEGLVSGLLVVMVDGVVARFVWWVALKLGLRLRW